MFKIEITADTAIELGEKIAALNAQFGGGVEISGSAAPVTPNDKPKPRRSKTDSAPADGAASEPSSPNASKLEPADEGNVGVSAGTNAASDTAGTSPDAGSTSSTSTTATTAASPSESAGPTRDDALAEATKFSQLSAAQGGGADALEAVLRQFGALDGETPRFSKLTEAQYGDFIAEMKKRKQGASSALS